MDKLIHPTSKNIYLWGLVDAFCLFSFVLYGAFYISNSICTSFLVCIRLSSYIAYLNQ